MTQHDPIGRALTGPADHRHIPQDLDRITGISAVLHGLRLADRTRQAEDDHLGAGASTS